MQAHARWIARRIAVGLLLAALPLLPAAPAAAAGLARGLQVSAPSVLPPQGLYEGCRPDTPDGVCIDHLRTIRAAGFRYVLNYSAWYGTRADVRHYADGAAELGLELIWPLNQRAWRGLASLSRTYPNFACNCAARKHRGHGKHRTELSNREFIARAIGLVARHPATWGFYIGDELQAAETGRVANLGASVRRLAPRKPQLYMARPGAARLRPFVRYADLAGADPYPIGSEDEASVPEAARSARKATFATGTETAMALQAFSWSQHDRDIPARYPTAPEMREMRDAAIRNARPAMILWFSYYDILRSDDPARRWRNLVRAAFSPFP